MTDSEGGPGPMAWWDELLADAAASARRYEERGWETLQFHTADVTPLDGEYGDRIGLSVLVPDDEFDDLQSLFADVTVDGYDVYRTVVTDYVALLVVLEDEGRETAVLVPAYYAMSDDAVDGLFDAAVADGELTIYLRNLADDSVEVTLSEPELLAPPEREDTDATESDANEDGTENSDE
jgi:hypothetical protein